MLTCCVQAMNTLWGLGNPVCRWETGVYTHKFVCSMGMADVSWYLTQRCIAC